MKRILFAAVAVMVSFSFAGCSDESDAEPIATVTVTESATQEPVEGQLPDDIFIKLVQDQTESFDYVPDATILELAQNICEFWESGGTVEQAFQIVRKSGIDSYDGGFFIGAATEAYCPEYSDRTNA